jgi:mono/diheme cytochrome c family protein
MPRRHVVLLVPLLRLLSGGSARADDDDKVDFRREVQPIFDGACTGCHGAKKASGGLRLSGVSHLLAGGITGPLFTAGKGKDSTLVKRLRGGGGEDRMPLGAPPLTKKEIETIERWIDQGAKLPPAEPTVFVPAPGGVRRLTVAQYRSSVRDLLGDGAQIPGTLEPDTLVSGSAAVGAGRIAMSRQATEKFGVAAFALARQAVADGAWWGRWVSCPADAPFDAACAGQFLAGFGQRAWRRPLDAGETARYLGLARRGPQMRAGVEAVLAALLQSPHFLYRAELGVPDPTDPGRRVLSDHEMASRLSYFLWGAPPDQALLDAAAAGRLSTEEGLRAEAERMLRSPRSRDTVETFFSELLRLGKLERLPQFRSQYKQVSSTLGASMRGETLRVVDEIALAPDRDLREMFDARFTYLNGELAGLYDLPAPADADAGVFVRVALPADSRRLGILGQGSFLAINAHPTASSPTKRGKFIRETLLCQPVPPPPPDVSTKLPKDKPGQPRTARQKLAVHRKSAQCAGCHKAMDPLGLAFETYDGIGAYRDRESGLLIDPSGELDGVPFTGPRALAGLLRASPAVGVCVARNLLRFALGHLESEGEEPLIDELSQGLERDGYRFLSLVLNVVASRGFRYLSAP